MRQSKRRTQDDIFKQMHMELRRWNPDIAESSERMDPFLKMLLQLFSNQLEKIESEIDNVWDVARNSLIRSLFPDCKRWPVPASTIMQCELTDPVVDVDTNTQFLHRERREGGQTFHFSPHRSEKLVAAEVRHILVKAGDRLLDFGGASPSLEPAETPAVTSLPDSVYLGISFEGLPNDFKDSTLMLQGRQDALKQLRWAYWYPGDSSGGFTEKAGFCPGITTSIDDVFRLEDDSLPDWGGLRSSSDLFKPLEDSFVILPDDFITDWEKGTAHKELGDMAFSSGLELRSDDDGLFWIRIALPEGGNKRALLQPFSASFNCLVAVNKNELTVFKHTGGNTLVELEIPEDIMHLVDIGKVSDSDGNTYVLGHEVRSGEQRHVYSIEERGDKAVLWFDFSSSLEPSPDSLTVSYSVTGGTDANGIEIGQVDELYERHPGIASVKNLISTSGAIPAKTIEQVVAEAVARLRSRDRALTFQEIENWVSTFDPRITDTKCGNSTELTPHGVRRCIAVQVSVRSDDIHSDDEVSLLQARLTRFLKSRSPVNTQYSVEIARK